MHVKLKTLFILSLLLFPAIILWGDGSNGSEQEILDVWRHYLQALAERDSETALKYASQDTFQRFEELRIDCLELTPREIRFTYLFKALLILQLRAELSTNELENMTGIDLFSYLVKKGCIALENPDDLIVKNINENINVISGVDALVRVYYQPDKQSEVDWEFRTTVAFSRDGNDWKIGHNGLLLLLDSILEAELEKQGVEPREFLWARVMELVDQYGTERILHVEPALRKDVL